MASRRMCGLSFLLDWSGAPDSVALLRRLHEPIRHRGPDGEGFTLLEPDGTVHRPRSLDGAPQVPVRAGMAFRRLIIRDRHERASQPMFSPDGSVAVMFNGEIYNEPELRRRLEADGTEFRTSGDTEVVLAAYARWGARAFEELDGMWAIVILDLRRRQVTVSRDRLGIKPLYWFRKGDRLFIASEIKQILAVDRSAGGLNTALARGYLEGRRTPVLDETFFREVRTVPPASRWEISLDEAPSPNPAFQSYWTLSDARADATIPYEQAQERFELLLSSAVDTHRIADVKVGSLLSGGLDSSTLALLAATRMRNEGRDFPTFSFGFRERAPELCEMKYVDRIARANGLENHEATLDAGWVVRNEARVLRALEEPPLGLAAFAQFRIFELSREHGATVVLDGEGSDEVLGGYPYHQRLMLMERARRLQAGSFVRELGAIATRQRMSRFGLLSHFFFEPALRRGLGGRRSPAWLQPGWGARQDASETAAAAADAGSDACLVNRRLYQDVRWGNVKLVLLYTDKTSMAHSVEARVPFLDRNLVEFAFSLPAEYKVGRGDRKRILRDVARRLLPAEITERSDRMGFATPDERILREELAPRLASVLTDPKVLSAPCFRRDALTAHLDAFERGEHRDFRSVWRIYALASWAQEFGISLQ